MLAESIRDLLSLALGAPFKRMASLEESQKHIELMKKKWAFLAARYEIIIQSNHVRQGQSNGQGAKQQQTASNGKSNGKNQPAITGYLIGDSMTYPDILLAHVTTWFVEECGPDLVENMPGIVELQNKIISLPGVQSFIKSKNFFSVGDLDYCQQVTYSDVF